MKVVSEENSSRPGTKAFLFFCLILDDNALARALDSEFGELILSELVRERWPYVLASKPVFVDALKRSA